MDTYIDILKSILQHERIEISFPNLQINAEEIVEMECYKIIERIKATIQDDSLSDEECFMRIEQIIECFEKYGIDAGVRHDFG